MVSKEINLNFLRFPNYKFGVNRKKKEKKIEVWTLQEHLDFIPALEKPLLKFPSANQTKKNKVGHVIRRDLRKFGFSKGGNSFRIWFEEDQQGP